MQKKETLAFNRISSKVVKIGQALNIHVPDRYKNLVGKRVVQFSMLYVGVSAVTETGLLKRATEHYQADHLDPLLLASASTFLGYPLAHLALWGYDKQRHLSYYIGVQLVAKLLTKIDWTVQLVYLFVHLEINRRTGETYENGQQDKESWLGLFLRVMKLGGKYTLIGPLWSYIMFQVIPLGVNYWERTIILGMSRSLLAIVLFARPQSVRQYIENTPNYLIAGALEGVLNGIVKPWFADYGPGEQFYMSSMFRHFAKPIFQTIEIRPYLGLIQLFGLAWMLHLVSNAQLFSVIDA